MYLSKETIKWGTFASAIISAIFAIMHTTCRTYDEGFCNFANDFGTWFGAIAAIITFVGVMIKVIQDPPRYATGFMANASKYGLPILSMLTILATTSSASLHLVCGEDEDNTGAITVSVLSAILATLTLLLIGFETFRYGIGSGSGSYNQGYDSYSYSQPTQYY
tara:strand:- start:869 stop:1360 length:492 start_codon:yes stop_codon:yes gene_type:complete